MPVLCGTDRYLEVAVRCRLVQRIFGDREKCCCSMFRYILVKILAEYIGLLACRHDNIHEKKNREAKEKDELNEGENPPCLLSFLQKGFTTKKAMSEKPGIPFPAMLADFKWHSSPV